MKKILFVLLLSVFVFSCSSDNDEPIKPIDEETKVFEGKQIFRVDVKELTAKNLSVGNQKNQDPAFVLLSINDANGNAVFTREKMALIKNGDSYVSVEITLASGTYSVTEFIVTDANDVVLLIAPKEGSVLAQFATKPLPFDFVVSAAETNETATDNINAAGYTSVDFGYTGLSLTFSENTNFFTLTVDDSELLTTKMLELESITGATYLIDWGDGTVDEYTSTLKDSSVEYDITHNYTENKEFTITISGAIEAIETLSFTGQLPNGVYQYQTNLVAIDLSKLKLLKDLFIYTGKLTGIDISMNTALENLSVRENMLTSIDLSNHPHLKSVYVGHNALTHIDVSSNLDLEILSITENQISNLDVSKNSKLISLFAWENQLNAIDLTNNSDLKLLSLSHNNLTSIDLTKNSKLLDFSAGDNQITTIDFSNNPQLRQVNLFQNQLTSLHVSTNLNLTGLFLEDNQLSELNLLNNTELESFTIKDNMLTELDLASNQKINAVHILNNQFSATELDNIITQTYDHATANHTMKGFIDYQNNPGFADIDPTSLAKLNELVESLNWTIIDY